MTTTTRHRHSKHSAPHHAAPRPRTGIEDWQDGIDKADDRWDAYDCEVQTTVNAYNMHLAGTPGYLPLDWRIIKAMLWVETGAKRSQWASRPMQIGNAGDPGLAALLGDKEGGQLIIPPALRLGLSSATASSVSTFNIRAGVGYLLMRMANFAHRSVLDADARVYEVSVGNHDTIERIAKAQGSTPEVMKKLNPGAHLLKPGQVLKYRKASVQKVITGWKTATLSSVPSYYNGGGDALYAKKLGYAFAALSKRTEVECK